MTEITMDHHHNPINVPSMISSNRFDCVECKFLDHRFGLHSKV